MTRSAGRPEVQGASAALTPVDHFNRMVWGRRRELSGLFPQSQEGEGEAILKRLIVIAGNAYSKLLATSRDVIDPRSVMEAVVLAAQLGLEAGTDEAYLVPYKGIVQLIVGPQGLIQLAYRSNQIRSVVAEVAKDNDDFDYDLGHPGYIRHKKAPKNRGELAYAYAFFETTAGGVVRKVLTAEDIAYYRKFSKASKGPWIDNEEAMWRKTALKRALAYAPRNKLLSMAMCEDDDGATVVPPTIKQVVEQEAPAASQSYAERERPDQPEEPARQREPGED